MNGPTTTCGALPKNNREFSEREAGVWFWFLFPLDVVWFCRETLKFVELDARLLSWTRFEFVIMMVLSAWRI
jgi:hypothetical protein